MREEGREIRKGSTRRGLWPLLTSCEGRLSDRPRRRSGQVDDRLRRPRDCKPITSRDRPNTHGSCKLCS